MSRYIDYYDEYVINNLIIAYLYEGKTQREIQNEILNLPAPVRGGGFVAMDILHHYGITGKKEVYYRKRLFSKKLSKGKVIIKKF